jgi:hypothetical protein
MVNFEWFVSRMKNTFQTEVLHNDVSCEEFDFYHDELDELLIPVEHLEKLPNPLILQSFSYIDKHGYEWVAGVVEDEETKRLLYEVWIKNGEAIAYEIYVD